MIPAISEISRKAIAKRNAAIAGARADAGSFVEYVMRHEADGSRLTNAGHHREWHLFLDETPYAVISAPVEHAKTQQIAVGRVLWELGRNPNLRIVLVSNAAEQATKVLSLIRNHIETNPRVQEVFPHLRRSTKAGALWSSDRITVGRDTRAKEASITAVGSGSKQIIGSRFDLIIGDDLLDFENTRTPDQVEKTLHWFDSTLLSRVTDGGRVWIIGTPWTTTDLLHTLGSRPGWVRKVYSAVLNPEDPPELWRPLWPDSFSRERLIRIASGMTPINFARSYLCAVRTDATSRFRQDWIDHCAANGKGRTLIMRAPIKPSGMPYPCFTGVDLSIGKNQHSDLSCIFTIYLDERHRKVVANVQAGRWQAPEILNRVLTEYQRFNSTIFVEDNGAQSFLVQWANDQGLPVRGFTTTGRNKYDVHFGVESLAIEMRAGHWVIPSGMTGADMHAEVRQWIQELLFYNPDAHTGDRLMASWLAREAARLASAPMEGRLDTLSR